MKRSAQKKMKVVLIHGGKTFKNDDAYRRYLQTKRISFKRKGKWSDAYLDTALGKNYTVVRPKMPLQENARYRDWKIVFERYIPLFGRKYILIGNSLGGIFLAKYLSENKLPSKALSVYLVCPPFDDTSPSEELAGGFLLGKDLSPIEGNCRHLHLLFSQNDDVVPVTHAEKYRHRLPFANISIYRGKNGHFNVPTFPEIVRMIKKESE